MTGHRRSHYRFRVDGGTVDTEAVSRLLSNFSADAKSTDRQDVPQTPPISGPTTTCAGFRRPGAEASQHTADRSANAGAPSSIWGIPVYDGPECAGLELSFIDAQLEDLVRRAHIVFRRTAEGDVSDLELLSDGPLPHHRSLGR